VQNTLGAMTKQPQLQKYQIARKNMGENLKNTLSHTTA